MSKRTVPFDTFDNKIIFIFGLIVILLTTCFMWWFIYVNEPMGDDVLINYEGALTLYLDEVPDDIGNLITSPGQIPEVLKFVYLRWSGRITGYAALYFGNLLPQIIQALITALIFSGNVILTLRIVYKSTAKAVSASLIFTLLYLVTYWYRGCSYYEYMRTLVCVYSLPVFLVLLYYNMVRDRFSSKRASALVLMQILGLFAGLSHEVLSLLLIVMVGADWIRDMILKRAKFSDVFKHFGLGIGYLICFFAPGNFNRAGQSHDITNTTYPERLVGVLRWHLYVLVAKPAQRLVFAAVLLTAFIVLVIMVRKKEDIAGALLDKIGLIAACVLSVFICAAPPRCMVYGEDLWIFMVYALLLGFAVRITDYLPVGAGLYKAVQVLQVAATVAVLAVFTACNFAELRSYSSTSLERRALVSEAVRSGAEDVVVPRFADDLSHDRYLLEYLNDQEQYDTDYYRGYYGTHVIIGQ